MPIKSQIHVPIADLLWEPKPLAHQDYSHQQGRQTQLVFGEQVEILSKQEHWAFIQTLEQIYFDEMQGWSPLKGWVLNEQLVPCEKMRATEVVCLPNNQFSYGTLLSSPTPFTRELPKTPCRAQIAEEARLFIDAPYLWGGRGSFGLPFISSVDCSGILNLLYRAQGINLPRNSFDQYLRAKPTSQLLPADPLFLAREKRIGHVVIKLDETTFIEAPETGKKVRTLTWGKEIWEEDGSIHFFDRPHSFTPYPATFLSDQ